MPDYGQPTSYLALDQGTPVYSSDGDEIGTVDHVLEDDREDIFEGIVVAHHSDNHRRLLGHDHSHCYIDADQIDSMYDRGVLLKVSTPECVDLPKPSANPAVIYDNPADTAETHRKLRRAWDRISGNY
jgi:uncharacterized protein YrrD